MACYVTTVHSWCGGLSTSINTCEMWGPRAEIQLSRREFHTHIYLDYTKVKILSCINKKIKEIMACYVFVFFFFPQI